MHKHRNLSTCSQHINKTWTCWCAWHSQCWWFPELVGQWVSPLACHLMSESQVPVTETVSKSQGGQLLGSSTWCWLHPLHAQAHTHTFTCTETHRNNCVRLHSGNCSSQFKCDTGEHVCTVALDSSVQENPRCGRPSVDSGQIGIATFKKKIQISQISSVSEDTNCSILFSRVGIKPWENAQ